MISSGLVPSQHRQVLNKCTSALRFMLPESFRPFPPHLARSAVIDPQMTTKSWCLAWVISLS